MKSFEDVTKEERLFLKKKTLEKKQEQEKIKELVIARLKTMPDAIRLCIG